MDLTYELWGTGWATAMIRSGGSEVKATASYLNDPLLELAEAALRLSADSPGTTVVFMDEPGEHHLILRRSEGDTLSFEVRWFEDWASWGLHPTDRFEVVLEGETTVRRFRHQVVNVLRHLDETLGPERYKQQWDRADFPAEAYRQLTAI